MAFEALERGLAQAGQVWVGESFEEEVVVVAVEKVIVMRVFRLSGCGSWGAELGQRGWRLRGEEAWVEEFVEGVREGTQKAGRVGMEAWWRLVSGV